MLAGATREANPLCAGNKKHARTGSTLALISRMDATRSPDIGTRALIKRLLTSKKTQNKQAFVVNILERLLKPTSTKCDVLKNINKKEPHHDEHANGMGINRFL